MLDFECERDLVGEKARIIADISGERVTLENPSYACNYYGSQITRYRGKSLKAGLGVGSGILNYLEIDERVFISASNVNSANLIGIIFTLVFSIAMTISFWFGLKKVNRSSRINR